jgi:uncharacterized zinc-type alcohol dehydrogenase-like protein
MVRHSENGPETVANVETVTEEYPMSQANEAMAHIEAGKARYRVVLKNDLN